MTAIQRFALHGTIMNPHSSGPYVRHEDHLAAMQGRCLAQIEEPAQPIAGYRISDPSDPELGFWFSDTPCAEGYTSEPLYAGAAPAAVAPQGEYPHEQMDAMALARYKVVPSHASMLWSHAVVAGDGVQQLYVGREAECQNMARKFAGAFLDGAFAFHSMAAAPTTQAAPALEAPAAPSRTSVAVLQCDCCGHIGINDAADGKAACNTCRWTGDSPAEDKCPGCNRVGTMTTACPECGARTTLIAETHLQAPAALEAPAAPAPAVPDGWRLVPANPTDAMLGAAQKAWLADPLRRSSTLYDAALAAAPQAPAALEELRKIAAIAACWGCDHPDAPGDTETVRRIKWAARQLRAAAQAPAAPAVDAETIEDAERFRAMANAALTDDEVFGRALDQHPDMGGDATIDDVRAMFDAARAAQAKEGGA